MKKSLFSIAIFIVSVFVLNAQPYQSLFGKKETAWNVVCSVIDWDLTDSLFVAGDTIIGKYNYKIIKNLFGWCLPPEKYVREDTVHGKAWIRNYYGGAWDDYLFMNLSLVVGDTFRYYHWGLEEIGIVDSVKFIDGRKHVILACGWAGNPVLYNHYPLTFIEGIGPNAGIFYQAFDHNTYGMLLLCAFKDLQTTYSNNPYWPGLCRYQAGGLDELQRGSGGIHVYPVPSQDMVRLDSKGANLVFIEILDFSGKSLFSKPHAGTSYEFDISNFPQGLYVIRAKDSNGNRRHGRFVKL
jgi:hypothetical protein